MKQTHHVNQRMNQRGITKAMIDFTLDYGVVKGDRWVLNRKEVDKTIKQLEATLRTARKLRDKGGVVVVADNESVITAYNYNSRRNAY